MRIEVQNPRVKVHSCGGSQAVFLPHGFQFERKWREAVVRWDGERLVLEPVEGGGEEG